MVVSKGKKGKASKVKKSQFAGANDALSNSNATDRDVLSSGGNKKRRAVVNSTDDDQMPSDDQHMYPVMQARSVGNQTNLPMLIVYACNLLLGELDDAQLDQELTKRIKQMVKRIVAKAKQHSGVIPGLVGAHYGCNPKKMVNFVDMHNESSPDKAKKSWHLSVGGLGSGKNTVRAAVNSSDGGDDEPKIYA